MDRQGIDRGFDDYTVLIAHVNFTYPQGKLLSITGQLPCIAQGGGIIYRCISVYYPFFQYDNCCWNSQWNTMVTSSQQMQKATSISQIYHCVHSSAQS